MLSWLPASKLFLWYFIFIHSSRLLYKRFKSTLYHSIIAIVGPASRPRRTGFKHFRYLFRVTLIIANDGMCKMDTISGDRVADTGSFILIEIVSWQKHLNKATYRHVDDRRRKDKIFRCDIPLLHATMLELMAILRMIDRVTPHANAMIPRAEGRMSRRKKEAESEEKEWVRGSMMRQRGISGGWWKSGGPSCGSIRDSRGGWGSTIGRQQRRERGEIRTNWMVYWIVWWGE